MHEWASSFGPMKRRAIVGREVRSTEYYAENVPAASTELGTPYCAEGTGACAVAQCISPSDCACTAQHRRRTTYRSTDGQLARRPIWPLTPQPTQRTRFRNTPAAVSPDSSMPTSPFARGPRAIHSYYHSLPSLPAQFLSSSTASTTTAALVLLALVLPMADAHDHAVGTIPDGAATSPDPIDSTLWAHIFVNMLAFGVMFPVGMVLGVRPPSSSTPSLGIAPFFTTPSSD